MIAEITTIEVPMTEGTLISSVPSVIGLSGFLYKNDFNGKTYF